MREEREAGDLLADGEEPGARTAHCSFFSSFGGVAEISRVHAE